MPKNDPTSSSRPSGLSRGRTVLWAILLAIGWGTLFTGSWMHVLPDNALTPKRPVVSAWGAVVPQGWNFFTRDPTEERLFIYRRRGDLWEPVLAGTYAEPIHRFGVGRSHRATLLEAAILLDSVPDWVACSEPLVDCIRTLERPKQDVLSTFPNAQLCGEVALLLQKPMPWAWKAARDKLTMPSTAARLSVACS